MECYSSYRILPAHKLMLCCFKGNVRIEDFISLSMRLSQDPEYSTTYHVIFDFSEAVTILFNMDIKSYFDFLASHITFTTPVKTAFLTTSYNWKFLIEENLDRSQSLKMEVRQFHHQPECLSWIGIESPEFPEIGTAMEALRTGTGPQND